MTYLLTDEDRKAVREALHLWGAPIANLDVEVLNEKIEQALAILDKLQRVAPCPACKGSGEVETGIGMLVCDTCHGVTYAVKD